jgi:hypothetical protein
MSTFQFTTKDKIDQGAQYTIDYLYGELRRIESNITELSSIADTLQNISMPTALTVNECNAEIQVVEKSLSIRSRKLLKRPRLAMTPKAVEPIEYVERPDPAMYCSFLYAPCESSSDESSEEKEADKVREIRTGNIGGSGEDLTDGILAVDGVRFLSNKVR